MHGHASLNLAVDAGGSFYIHVTSFPTYSLFWLLSPSLFPHFTPHYVFFNFLILYSLALKQF